MTNLIQRIETWFEKKCPTAVLALMLAGTTAFGAYYVTNNTKSSFEYLKQRQEIEWKKNYHELDEIIRKHLEQYKNQLEIKPNSAYHDFKV